MEPIVIKFYVFPETHVIIMAPAAETADPDGMGVWHEFSEEFGEAELKALVDKAVTSQEGNPLATACKTISFAPMERLKTVDWERHFYRSREA